MREHPRSIADALMSANVLLDGRYRLDALIRRSATATIHVATHRNGSSAWLKIPVAAAHAPLLAIEGRVANTIGSPLIVRDDGTTPEGVPYLVLDPPDGESLAALRARCRKGTRLTLARTMTAGDALVRAVGSIHTMGYVTSGLDEEDLIVYANGDVALLDLHALVEATPAGISTDVRHVLRVLSALIADVADTASAPAVGLIKGTLAAAYPEIAALQAAWRAAAPEPIALPSRNRSGSLADIGSAPTLSAHDTPLSVTVGDEPPRQGDDSVIGYLRSGGVPSVPPPVSRPQGRALMTDPLSNFTEMPRLLQATSRDESSSRASRRPLVLAALIGAPLLVLLGGAVLLASPSSPSPRGAAAALEVTTAVTATPAPALSVVAAPAVVAPVASAEPPADDLEDSTHLRSEGAPPGRDVFVDGKVIGKTPLDVSVPCGRHSLQMVAGAPKQAVELPCGGERVVRYDAKGHWALK